MDTDQRLANAKANLALEGLYLTNAEEALARRVIAHEISYDQAVV